MQDKEPILIILKPEVFDAQILYANPEIFFDGVVLPSPTLLLWQLFEDIVTDYSGPYETLWSEWDIRSLYNQPHHMIPEVWFPHTRVNTLVDIYTGRYMQFFVVYGSSETPKRLTDRKKEIRKKFLRNPHVAFYSLFHVSDTLVDGKREVDIYKKYIQWWYNQ